MTNLQLRIIKRAINIRVTDGEKIEDAVNYYTALSDKEKTNIISELLKNQ